MLVAQYSFDTGAVVDESGGGRNGTLVNSPTFPTGHTNLGLQCASASSQYVTVADDPIWNLGSAWTIMCWFNPTTLVSGGSEIICKQNQWWFSATDSGSGGFLQHGFYKSGGGTLSVVTSAPTISTATWQHVAARYDGTNLQLVINGVQSATSAVGAATMIDSTDPIRFGSWDGASEFMNGIMDDGKIFNTYLNDAAVTTEMNTPVTPAILTFEIGETGPPFWS